MGYFKANLMYSFWRALHCLRIIPDLSDMYRYTDETVLAACNSKISFDMKCAIPRTVEIKPCFKMERSS